MISLDASLYLLLALLALSVGSLLNVIIYRLPILMKAEWKAECRSFLSLAEESEEKLNLFYPRSFCIHCKTMIPFWHNIPLFSFLILRGRCHHCASKISWRYPLIELLTLSLSLFAAWYFGFNPKLIFVLLFIWLLIAIFFIDLENQLVPDSLSLSLLWLGLIANTQSLFTSLPDAVLSAAAAYLGLWLFVKVYYLFTGKIGMGNGDFKLFAAFAAWFGWTELPFILLLSSLIGAILGIIYLKSSEQSKDTPIPFGPFLCFSALISLFYGKWVVTWYLNYNFFTY